MSRAKKEKRINPFSKLTAHLLGISHLPAPGQICEVCGAKGHLTCWEVQGPDTEHLFIELDSIERRHAA